MKNREDFSAMTEQELQERYKHYKEELFNLRFQAVTGQLANPARISIVRRNIARVRTFMTRLEKNKLHDRLKAEYEAMLKEYGKDTSNVPLRTKISKLKTRLSNKEKQLNREIKNDCDKQIKELVKDVKAEVSEQIKSADAKNKNQLKAVSKKLSDPKYKIKNKFLDKLTKMGLNNASRIATVKAEKREKLHQLEEIRALQRELTAGKLPF